MKCLNEEENFLAKTGKNYYITNPEQNIKITINSNTFRVITVELLTATTNDNYLLKFHKTIL